MVEKRFGSMSDLKTGKYVIIDDHPCRVVGIEKSKPGKHGAAKMRVNAFSLFDNSKHILMKPADADIEIPIIERKRAQIVSVSGTTAQLMDLASYETFETEIPEEMRDQVEVGKEMQYMNVMGKRLLLQIFGGG